MNDSHTRLCRLGRLSLSLALLLAAACSTHARSLHVRAELVPADLGSLTANGMPEPSASVVGEAVRRRLLRDPTPGLDTLRVSVDEGIVQLSGTVPTLAARERVVEIVSSTKGARALVNEVAVVPPSASDPELAVRIGARLVDQSAIDPGDVAIVVDDGAVTLVGDVESRVERNDAVTIAARTPGVRSIDDRLEVERPLIRTDREIRTDVVRAVSNDLYARPAEVGVDVSDGVVHLSGAVGTPSEKDRLVALAAVHGARAVDASELRIDWTSEPMSRAHPRPPSDDDVAAAVEHALDASPRVPNAFLFVDVEDGVATLDGDVVHAHQRDAATQAALAVEGVRWVVNDLDVVEQPRARR